MKLKFTFPMTWMQFPKREGAFYKNHIFYFSKVQTVTPCKLRSCPRPNSRPCDRHLRCPLCPGTVTAGFDHCSRRTSDRGPASASLSPLSLSFVLYSFWKLHRLAPMSGEVC